MVETTLKAFGRVDILAASVGIFNVASIEDTTEDIWDRHLDLNLKSMFFCVRAVTPDDEEAEIRPHHHHELDRRALAASSTARPIAPRKAAS